MSTSITVYLIDQNGAYLHETEANQLTDESYNVPWNGVLTQPPAAAAGEVPVWNAAAQAWAQVADNRSAKLYRTDTATEYSVGSTVMVNSAAVAYNGLGAAPSWLTSEVPPAPGSTWTNGAWVAPAAPTGGTTTP